MHVAWFLQIPPNPCSTTSTSTTSPLPLGAGGERPTAPGRSFRFLRSLMRSSVRASGDNTPPQNPPRTVSWNTHVENVRQTSKSVSWNTHVEVFTIPARKESFEEDALSCEHDTLTPCVGFSDHLTASNALVIKRDPLE